MRFIAASVVCLVLGAFPFLFLEGTTPPGGGASFAFMIWIVLGPPICFVLLPVAYWLTRSTGVARFWIYPAVVSVVGVIVLLVSIAQFSGTMASEAQGAQNDDAMYVFMFLLEAAIWGSWFAYVKIREF